MATKKSAPQSTSKKAKKAAAPTAWETRVGSFSSAISAKTEAVSAALATIAGDPSDDALKVLENAKFTPFDDIKAALSSADINPPVGVLRSAIANLRASEKPAANAAVPAVGPSFGTVLPAVLDDTSLLSALKAGGELKVDKTTVLSGLRATLADRVGLYDLTGTIADAMEAHADVTEDEIDPLFFRLRKQLTRRAYGDLFAAIDGLDGSFVSNKRKKVFLDRCNEQLWPALRTFAETLRGWQDAWLTTMGNPAGMMGVLAGALGGGGAGGMIPPGMMEPPPTDAIRDAAETFADITNRTFAGARVPAARALAYDALQIREVLNNSALPRMIGVDTKELMLKKLGVGVTAADVRLERNVIQYALAVMELPTIPSGQQELYYLSALVQLGTQIPWDSVLRVTPVTSSRKNAEGATRFDR